MVDVIRQMRDENVHMRRRRRVTNVLTGRMQQRTGPTRRWAKHVHKWTEKTRRRPAPKNQGDVATTGRRKETGQQTGAMDRRTRARRRLATETRRRQRAMRRRRTQMTRWLDTFRSEE